MKIVINKCHGGFGLSEKAMYRYAELAGFKLVEGDKHSLYTEYYKNEVGEDCGFWEHDIERDDPILIQVVEELGEEAWGFAAELKVVEIPDGVDWEINEYDGWEHIAEKHRTWS
jgi:hypothetical protein